MSRRRFAYLSLIVALLGTSLVARPALADETAEPASTVVITDGATRLTRLALAPDWLYGSDVDGTWVRQGNTTFSAPKDIPVTTYYSTLSASAGRAIVPGSFVDRGKLTRSEKQFSDRRDSVSGPRARLAYEQILNLEGRTELPLRPTVAIFGETTLTRDALLGANTALFMRPVGQTLRDVWGPWVRSTEGTTTHVENWQTKASGSIDHTIYGQDGLLGDGVYVTSLDGMIHVFDVSKAGELQPVVSFPGVPKAIERNRLAWVDANGLIKVSVLPVGGTSSPIFLGAAGAKHDRSINQPWDFGLDFSAPLTAGRVEIRIGSGQLVRSIPTPSTADGSLRLLWDVRDASGKPVRNGTYSWTFIGKDVTGRAAVGFLPGSPVTGSIKVAANQFVSPPAPDWIIPCGKPDAEFVFPDVEGVSYGYSKIDTAGTVITATVQKGWILTGSNVWTLKPRKQSCDGIVAAPRFIDEGGTQQDRIVIPKAVGPVSNYLINGAVLPAGVHNFYTGSVLVEAQFYEDVPNIQWRHTFSSGGPVDVYITPGEHVSNGRRWLTTCEKYSITSRCRTEIWATTIQQEGGRFVQKNGWVFNNLTYLPSPRSAWQNNKLGHTAKWSAADGRNWRTECDTLATGRGGCRSYTQATIITSTAKAGGGFSYKWEKQWLFNNMVRFS